MASEAPCPSNNDDQPQPSQQPSGSGGGPYSDPPPYYGLKPSAESYQYPPGASYPPGNYGYPPALPPALGPRQQTIVIVNEGVLRQEEFDEDDISFLTFGAHKTFACLIMWFCGIVFGFVAYVLASMAQSSVRDGDISTARCLGHASLSMSLIGMIAFIVVLSVFLTL